MPAQKKERSPQALRILRLRRELGFDQEGFAAKLRVDQGTVSKWENDKAVPGPHTYRLLASLTKDEGLRCDLLADGGLFDGIAQFGEVSQSSEEPLLDRRMLLFVIETILSGLERKGLKLPAKKLAQAIALSYEFCHRTQNRDTDIVERFLEVA